MTKTNNGHKFGKDGYKHKRIYNLN